MRRIIKIIALTIFTLGSTSIFADNNQTTRPDDATLTQDVQTKFAAEPALTSKTIIVKTNQGIVVLSATLDTSEQASKAIEIAESVPGVKDVDSSALTVKDSKQPFTDTEITAKIKGTFLRERLFGKVDVPVITINVSTKDGVVYLTGTASTKQQIKKAISLAKAIKDVKQVNSEVRVQQ